MDTSSNTYQVAPLEIPNKVDKRRKKVGLCKLDNYLSFYNIKWDVELYKKQLPEIEKKYKETFINHKNK